MVEKLGITRNLTSRHWKIILTKSGLPTVLQVMRYKTILKTQDGGNSWVIQTETKNGLLQDLQFYNSQIGYACGYCGTIYRTSDGGENWRRDGEGATENLQDVAFVDENTGWAVGFYGTIFHTTNSGEIWE